jgi:4-methyl-5(b-hydroxyethyl)-thiazole monophosphate biosynthesis
MKKAILFLADGFEEIEAITVIDILRRASIECTTCSIEDTKTVKGSHSISVQADILLTPETDFKYDAIVLPGGMQGAKALSHNKTILNLIKRMLLEQKIVAAICAAPIVLREANVIEGRKLTSFPGVLELDGSFEYSEDTVVVDGNLVTSRGPGTAAAFAFGIVSLLGYPDVADRLKVSMLFQ